MYKLTLTLDERRAIDWIGNCYGHGLDLYLILINYCDNEVDWNEEKDISFQIPEHEAWTIREIGEADNWACFAPALRAKMEAFCDSIV